MASNQFSKNHTNPAGAPATHPPQETSLTIKVCTKCYSDIGPGKPHHCVKTVKRDNMVSLLRNNSEKSQAAVTVSSLKAIAEDQNVSTRGGFVKLTSGSKLLPVQIGTSKLKRPSKVFSHEDLMALQRELNWSDNMTLKAAKGMRVVQGRACVEPHLSVALTQRNKTLNDLFDVKILEMQVKEYENDSIPQTIERFGVICSDLKDLVSHLIAKRGYGPNKEWYPYWNRWWTG